MRQESESTHIVNQKESIGHIESVLYRYFEGLYQADSVLLAKVFHPDARYINTVSGNYTNLSMSDYFKVIDKRQAPSESDDDYHSKIISIELGDTQMAFAKASIVMMGRQYLDFLTLTHTDGEWKIMSKVFSFQAVKTTTNL
jgi:hypothetical protein